MEVAPVKGRTCGGVVARVKRAIDLAVTSPAPFAALAALQLGLLDGCISDLQVRARLSDGIEMPLAPLLSTFLAGVPYDMSAVAEVDWLVLWHFRDSGEVGSLAHLRSLSTELCALASIRPRVASALAFGSRRLELAALHTAITRIEAVTLTLATSTCVPEGLRVLSSTLKHAMCSGGSVASAARQIEPLISRVGWNADASVVVDAVRGLGAHVERSAAERFAARVAIGATLMTI